MMSEASDDKARMREITSVAGLPLMFPFSPKAEHRSAGGGR